MRRKQPQPEFNLLGLKTATSIQVQKTETELVQRKPRIVATIRHGDYDPATNTLTEAGKEKIGALVDNLGPMIKRQENETVAVLSSTEIVSFESAIQFAQYFKVKMIIAHEDLRDDRDLKPEGHLMQVIRATSADIIIAVVHYKAPLGIIAILSNEIGSRPVRIVEAGYATGNLINLHTGEVKTLIEPEV